jgi:hypothetical protein
VFGDLDNSGVVDFTDISLSVDYFLGEYDVPLGQVDIAPCPPDGVQDFRDIAETVDAFLSGGQYPCDAPCP